MGAGKTTAGKYLAKSFNIPFYDLDVIIERHLNLTIPEIFSQKGEDYFRKIESKLLHEHNFSGIMACGGGVIESFGNREFLKDKTVIWLDTDWNIIIKRIKDTSRPLVNKLSEKELYALYRKRRKFYAEVAKFVIKDNDYNELKKIIISL
jgi:shikimate kinase